MNDPLKISDTSKMQTEATILGGSVEGMYPSVCLIKVGEDLVGTGTLIAKDLILTAAHVATALETKQKLSREAITCNFQLEKDPTFQSYTVTRIGFPPNYRELLLDKCEVHAGGLFGDENKAKALCFNKDVAVLKLEKEVGDIDPSPIMTSTELKAVASKQCGKEPLGSCDKWSFTFVGYGRSSMVESKKGGGEKLSFTSKPSQVVIEYEDSDLKWAEGDFLITYGLTPSGEYVIKAGEEYVLIGPGDSGGPVFFNYKGLDYLIATNVLGDPEEDESVDPATGETYPIVWRSFHLLVDRSLQYFKYIFSSYDRVQTSPENVGFYCRKRAVVKAPKSIQSSLWKGAISTLVVYTICRLLKNED